MEPKKSMKNQTHSTASRHFAQHSNVRSFGRCRTGFSLLETTVSFVLIGAAMATLVQTIWLARQQMQLIERQFIATQELANVMERLSLIPFDQLNSEHLPELQPSPELLRLAPRAKLSLEVADVAGPPVGKRLRAKVNWPTLSTIAREGSSPSPEMRVADSTSQETFELVTFRFSAGGER
jgi:type II secretory pathway pseudopilin PulG